MRRKKKIFWRQNFFFVKRRETETKTVFQTSMLIGRSRQPLYKQYEKILGVFSLVNIDTIKRFQVSNPCELFGNIDVNNPRLFVGELVRMDE
jgi:hypothetical protein